MLQYILIGLALGSIYAIASTSLVITFVSAGVLNFAFAAMAFLVARVYFWLNSQHGWATWEAGAFCLLVVGPVMGVALYYMFFQFIRGKSTLVKLVSTIGLYVALPPVVDFAFGTQAITSAPGFAALTDKPYKFLGAPVTTDTVITYGFLIFVVAAGTFILRFTDIGLKVRALVDSEAMASLSGTNPGRVAVGVWAVTATLAGLAGILVAPAEGLNIEGMTTLMAAAFAAVVAARLRSLPGAVAASMAMGLVTDIIQKYLPANSSFTAAVIPSIPFAFILVFLIFYMARSGTLDEGAGVEGPLDKAIKVEHAHTDLGVVRGGEVSRPAQLFGVIPLVVVAALPLIFRGSAYWLGLAAAGAAYAIMMLTFTIVTGEGGMLWLSQIIFAGGGALAAAQFVHSWHVPVLLAIVVGAILCSFVGAILGLLTIRLGDLYVALVTLTFGLLIEQLVFTRNRFYNEGQGVTLFRPNFAHSDLVFAYLALAVFLVLALFTVNLRLSTGGMALRAVRDSESASRTLGISVLRVKVIVGAIGAFVAAIGGCFVGMYANIAQPQSFDTFAGVVLLAVVTTMGIRSINAAALAGMAFSLFPGLFANYVPSRWSEVPQMMFGLGAIGVARHPEGAVTQIGRALRSLIFRSGGRSVISGATALPRQPGVLLGDVEHVSGTSVEVERAQ